jgi:hypothetical protein
MSLFSVGSGSYSAGCLAAPMITRPTRMGAPRPLRVDECASVVWVVAWQAGSISRWAYDSASGQDGASAKTRAEIAPRDAEVAPSDAGSAEENPLFSAPPRLWARISLLFSRAESDGETEGMSLLPPSASPRLRAKAMGLCWIVRERGERTSRLCHRCDMLCHAGYHTSMAHADREQRTASLTQSPRSTQSLVSHRRGGLPPPVCPLSLTTTYHEKFDDEESDH